MRGFTIICNDCETQVIFDKEINRNNKYIELQGSGQIDIDAVWIECSNCENKVRVGYTIFDIEEE